MKSFQVFMLTLLVAVSAQSMIKGGVKFRDSIKYNKKKLVLNGLGIREATIFNVDVYVAGIYLPAKTKDANKIIQSKAPKILKLKFVRDVDSDSLNGAWDKALKGKGFDKELADLKNATASLKEGDQLMFTFNSLGASYYVNKKRAAKFKNKLFSKALLKIWFGENPPNTGLKEGLLGIN